MTAEADILAALRTAKHIAVLTGAGASAESGVPTFRDALTGLWSKFDAEQLATPSAFARDPQMVAKWYDERRLMALQCQPNPGHQALADLQRRLEREGRRFTLITQNVDRLHQRAGSTGVIELHGSLFDWRCLTCGQQREELGPAFAQHPPPCDCGGIRRPGVVWFNEMLPEAALTAASHAEQRCDLFLSIGTSSVVYPAAGLIGEAIHRGARTLEINPQPTDFSARVTWSIQEPSGMALSRFVAAL